MPRFAGLDRNNAPRAAALLLAASAVSIGVATAQPAPPIRTLDEQERLDPRFGLSDGEVVVFRTTPTEAIEGAADAKFVLREVVIEGGTTVFSAQSLRDRFADLVGKEVSVADLAAIARCIEGAYASGRGGVRAEQCKEDGLRTRGYFTSRVIIPAQVVKDGVFRLVVVEGFINDTKIAAAVGAKPLGPVAGAVEEIVGAATEVRPLRDRTLERALLLVNDLPGVSAKSAIEAAADGEAVGGSDLEVAVARDPADLFLVVDNRGSQFTGPWAGFAGFALNSFTRYGERLEGIIFSSLDFDEQLVGQASYSQLVPYGPLAARGMRIGVTISNARTTPGSTLEPLEFKSKTFYASVYATYPFIRTQNLTLEGRVAGNFTNSDTDARGAEISRDRIRTVDLGVNLRVADDVGSSSVGGEKDNQTSASFQVRQGLDAFGASAADDVRVSRFNAGGSFTTVTGDVSRRQRLPLPKNWAPVWGSVRAAGQWTDDSVYSVEEFQLGGARFGRGYDPAALSGDNAIGVSGEVQVDFVGALRGISAPKSIADLGQALGAASPGGALFSAAQGYAFVDWGKTWNAEGGAFDKATLFSAGFGVRLRLADHFGVDIEGAKPLSCEACLTGQNDLKAFVRLVVY